jgi:hypothetical protein
MPKRDEKGKPTVKQIKERHAACERKWDEWRSIYDLCYTFAAPQRNLWGGHGEVGITQGTTKMNQVFDSTAISSTSRFANRVQANVFPPQKKWARLEPGTKIPPNRVTEIKRALEVVCDEMFAVMRSSNFDIAIGEFLTDLAIGTAHLCVQPGDYESPVNYTAVSPAHVRFEEDEYGRPCNHYRPLKVKAELITRLWKGAKLNADMERLVEKEPTKEVELLESTIKDLDTGRYHYQISSVKDEHEVYWRSQKYSNWVTARYSKLAGEILGRGPVVSALPDIRTLNRTKELLLKKAALSLAGVFTAVDDGVLNPNNVKIQSGTIIGVAANAGPRGPSLAPLPLGGDMQMNQIIINDLVMSIKRILLDESLPPDSASARSATEIIERMKELAQNMGSAFGRLIDEVLIPVVQITLMVLDEGGVIQLPLKVNGREIKAVPVSPLAMAQNMDEVENTFQFANMMSLLGNKGHPEVIFTDDLPDWLGDHMGVPEKVRRTPQDREAKLGEMQEQQKQAMVAQVAMDAASKAKPEAPAAPMGMLKAAA